MFGASVEDSETGYALTADEVNKHIGDITSISWSRRPIERADAQIVAVQDGDIHVGVVIAHLCLAQAKDRIQIARPLREESCMAGWWPLRSSWRCRA